MKKKILFALCLLFSLMFINAGLNKFLNYLPVPDEMPAETLKMFTAMMQISWLMPLVGVAEIMGGLLFVFPKTRALGAIILVPIMVGILLTTFTVSPEGFPIPVALLAICVWVIYENRHKYLPMVS